jgi:hypothetical protein
MSEQDQVASGETQETSGSKESEGKKSKDAVSYETYQRVLIEAKKAKDKAKEYEAAAQKAADEKLKEQNEWKKLADQYKVKLEESSKQLEEKEKLVANSLKYDAFKKNLNADLVDDKFVEWVDLDKIIIDPDTQQVNGDSAKMVAIDFLKNYPFAVKASQSKIPSKAGTSANIPFDMDQIKTKQDIKNALAAALGKK